MKQARLSLLHFWPDKYVIEVRHIECQFNEMRRLNRRSDKQRRIKEKENRHITGGTTIAAATKKKMAGRPLFIDPVQRYRLRVPDACSTATKRCPDGLQDSVSASKQSRLSYRCMCSVVSTQNTSRSPEFFLPLTFSLLSYYYIVFWKNWCVAGALIARGRHPSWRKFPSLCSCLINEITNSRLKEEEKKRANSDEHGRNVCTYARGLKSHEGKTVKRDGLVWWIATTDTCALLEQPTQQGKNLNYGRERSESNYALAFNEANILRCVCVMHRLKPTGGNGW